ncbi:hypothetical protein IAU60_003463 [Kwoniella sp. DSM 27419]
MPAVHHAAPSPRASQAAPGPSVHAPNPSAASSSGGGPNPQPAPGVRAAASHIETHFMPRRFLGQIPENVAHSDEVEDRRARLSEIRRMAVHRILHPAGEAGDGPSGGLATFAGGEDEAGRLRSAARRFKVIRRGARGEDIKEDLDLDYDQGARGKRGRKKSQRKDVWLGESFDIGREFLGTGVDRDSHEDSVDEQGEEEGNAVGESTGSTSNLKRPPVSSRTTQETFVTARTEFSNPAGGSRSTLSLRDAEAEGYELGLHTQLEPMPSMNRPSTSFDRDLPSHIRVSQSSSLQPLMVSSVDEMPRDGQLDPASSLSPAPGSDTPRGKLKSARGISRLRSALRPAKGNLKSSHSAHGAVEGDRHEAQSSPLATRGQKPKTVQFPVNPVQAGTRLPAGAHQPGRAGVDLRPRRGNKAPVDPMDVLNREGDQAAGTSAGAVEEALDEREAVGDEDDTWVEDKRPGEVIMRDRMLVRVGYHREEKIARFDESVQRRNPCARLEPFEEYIVVWRKSQIELYQDYKYPLQERIRGHKHLCFVIPLMPTRTSMTIFNSQDSSLAITTSVGRLQEDLSHLMRASTTRAGAVKDRVTQSRQFQWLRGRKRGTQVFIMKLGERSRALDWYWEIWRDLGGELPDRMEIGVPSLSTSIRLLVPRDDENGMVGGAEQLRMFAKDKVVQTCWDMLTESLDVADLRRQSEEIHGERLRLEMAWKSSDGGLDWVAFDSTVQKKGRAWALLAGLARAQGEALHRELQIRPARHQPKALKLEDGTRLDEPPGIEGYLVRHTTATTKDHVYISSHDGNIFVGNMKQARPPLLPQSEGSTPANMFDDVYHAFIDNEHRRMARFLERCSGCIDLRDIVSVNMVGDDTSKGSGKKARSRSRSRSVSQSLGNGDEGARPQESHGFLGDEANSVVMTSTKFTVEIATGGSVTFEAVSAAVAAEWVERLSDLVRYWKRKHRVDARQRMDAIASHSQNDPFAGTELSNESDQVLSEIWDWCTIEGCRSTCITGRLFMRKDRTDKFRSKYLVLTGGSLVSFKMKRKDAFHLRKKRYPLFGAYVYSGMLALEELPGSPSGDGLATEAKVYQDGLQSADGPEDTTFCVRLSTHPSIWGKKTTQPWEMEEEAEFLPPGLSKKPPVLLIFRARSKLERDRWVWAINAEMERQVRSHVKQEEALREYGKVPDRW